MLSPFSFCKPLAGIVLLSVLCPVLAEDDGGDWPSHDRLEPDRTTKALPTP